jgi:dethiobiotin synthetase
MKRTIFITGTDTGVGKTVLTALLAEFLRERGIRVAALKPVCSGGRGDARMLHAALGGALTLDEINPWHFRAPIAPLLAARREKKTVKLAPVLAHIRAVRKNFDVVLVEGAGGVLSPLGEDFDSRDLITALRAMPVIVASNKLGVVNQILLTLEALSESLRVRTGIVLMTPPKPDAATRTNASMLGELQVRNIFGFPWFGGNFSAADALQQLQVRPILGAIVNFGAPHVHLARPVGRGQGQFQNRLGG